MSEPLEFACASGQPSPDKRILVISRIGCPPPIGGNRMRMMTLLQEIKRLGYEVHFAGVRMSPEEKTATQQCVDQWVGDFTMPPQGLTRLGASLKYRTRRFFRRYQLAKDQVDEHFCDIWLQQAEALQQRGQYSRVLVSYVYHSRFLEAFPDSCLKILDTLDSYSHPRQRMQTLKAAGNLRYYTPDDERKGLLRAQRIIAIQEREAVYFRQLLGPEGNVYTIGHFAEVVDVAPPPAPFRFLGYIGSRKNHWINQQGIQWFLREVWPAIRVRLPEATLLLAGEKDEKAEADPGVRALGPIPSLEDFYRECPIFINPVLTGSGLKIKTIEALMHGRPVVTTSVGAEGLESFYGHGLYVGDSAREFADAAINLLSDLSQAHVLGEAAFHRVQEYTANNRRVLAEVMLI